MTLQGAPEGVRPPLATASSSSSIQLTWVEPARPGGAVQRYLLNQTGVGTVVTHVGGPRRFTVSGKNLDSSFLVILA